MVSTVTTSTVSTVTTPLLGLIALIGVILLLVLLYLKEITTVSTNCKVKNFGDTLNKAIIPLVIAFFLITAFRVIEVLN